MGNRVRPHRGPEKLQEDESLPPWPCKQREMIAKTLLAYIASVEKILAYHIDPTASAHYCSAVPMHVVHMHDFCSIIYLLHSAGGRGGGVGPCAGWSNSLIIT